MPAGRAISPLGLSFDEWARIVAADLGSNIVPLGLVAWQEWGQLLIESTPELAEAPSPYGFSDWVSWAEVLEATS